MHMRMHGDVFYPPVRMVPTNAPGRPAGAIQMHMARSAARDGVVVRAHGSDQFPWVVRHMQMYIGAFLPDPS